MESLFSFIAAKPIREQLAIYLSENVCPKGDPAGITISRLSENGMVECEFAFGFLRNDLVQNTVIPIVSDRPGADSMRRGKVIKLRRSDLGNTYLDFYPEEFMSDFQFAIILPIGIRRIYAIALQGDVDSIKGIDEYFDFVHTLISFYENTRSEIESPGHMSRPVLGAGHLTPRQEVILSKIKEERTNAAIALELGYSESLIRQETIAIYRKLGVNGRKELIPTTRENQGATR